MKITIQIVDLDGIETTREVEAGSVLSKFVPQGCIGILNGREESGSTTLRQGDRIKLVRQSGKAGC